MIKLVENELIKIFKRKSIYWLFALAFVGMIVYNNINPDQNPPDTYIIDTKDFPIESVEEALKNIDVNSEEFIIQMISIKRGKLWNEFEEGSWQRFALKDENTTYGGGFSGYMNLNKDIDVSELVLQEEEVSDAKWFEKEDVINRINNNFEGITDKGGCWEYLKKYYEWKDKN